MPFPLSPHAIDALADIITGGPGLGGGPPPNRPLSQPAADREVHAGLQRCVRRQRFARAFIGVLPDRDQQWLRAGEGAAPDHRGGRPRDFTSDPPRHVAVLDHLNRVLRYDGFELQQQGLKVRLVAAGHATPVVEQLSGMVETISFDTVQRDLDRALASIETDPEDAITAACSTIESVCRSILIELGEPLPAKKDVQGLFNAVKGPLGLSSDRSDLDPLIAGDVRTTLGGLATVIQGVGALRTHAGDAQGSFAGEGEILR